MSYLLRCLCNLPLLFLLGIPNRSVSQKLVGISAEYNYSLFSFLDNSFGGPTASVEYCPDIWDDIWRFKATLGSFSGDAFIENEVADAALRVRRRSSFIALDTRLQFEHPILDGTTSISVGYFHGIQSIRYEDPEVDRHRSGFSGIRVSVGNDLYITNNFAIFLEFSGYFDFKKNFDEIGDEHLQYYLKYNEPLGSILATAGLKYIFEVGKNE